MARFEARATDGFGLARGGGGRDAGGRGRGIVSGAGRPGKRVFIVNYFFAIHYGILNYARIISNLQEGTCRGGSSLEFGSRCNAFHPPFIVLR